MSLFDFLPGETSRPWPHIEAPFEDKIKKEIRKKVDEMISPDSDLGRVIHKARQETEQIKERQKNEEEASQNLFHIGEVKNKYEIADHLFIRIGPITHHAIYIGGNKVIHYSISSNNLVEICFETLENFSQGKQIMCMNKDKSPLKYSKEEAIRRAESRLGEKKYGLLSNNCEQFVRWCRSGGDQWIWEDD